VLILLYRFRPEQLRTLKYAPVRAEIGAIV